MRGPVGALLLLAAAGAYAEYLLRAASPEWDNVAIIGDGSDAGSASGGSGGSGGLAALQVLEGDGELLQGGAGPSFSGSGSGSGSGTLITVNVTSRIKINVSVCYKFRHPWYIAGIAGLCRR